MIYMFKIDNLIGVYSIMKNYNYLSNNKLFWINKRIFDIVISTLLLPLLIFVCCILLILNHFLNKGSLFFFQDRMGMNCESFCAIKFRTMVPVAEITRKYDDPVELGRITPLGKTMRKCRLDELPQIINVLKGEMSLIGPRPHCYIHALEYLKNIDGYRKRHDVLPGITGLSQIRLGYAEGLEATSQKVIVDNYYIQNIGYVIELKIIYYTIVTIIKGLGK